MLSRFVKIQLAIFTIVGTIGVIAMVLFYIQAPTLLGIGRMTVTLELPATGGLYRFSNVTYRGVQLGKVTSVGLTPTGAKATLSLSTSPKVPADLSACPERPGPPDQCGAYVLSVSAVGVDLLGLSGLLALAVLQLFLVIRFGFLLLNWGFSGFPPSALRFLCYSVFQRCCRVSVVGVDLLSLSGSCCPDSGIRTYTQRSLSTSVLNYQQLRGRSRLVSNVP